MNISTRSKWGVFGLFWLLIAMSPEAGAMKTVIKTGDVQEKNDNSDTAQDKEKIMLNSKSDNRSMQQTEVSFGNNNKVNKGIVDDQHEQRRELSLFNGGFFDFLRRFLNIITFGIIPGPSSEPDPNPTSVGAASSIAPAITNAPTTAPITATNAPIPDSVAPTQAPAPIPNECNQDDAFILFSGHNEAYSLESGFINITWSPAYVGTEQGESPLIFCGKYTYHIFSSEGLDEEAFLERTVNRTVPELIELANEDPNDDFRLDTTTDLFFKWDKFIPGVAYTILVTANIDEFGLFSENREPARLTAATVDPKLKDDFSKVIVLPPSDATGSTTERMQSDAAGFVTEVLNDGATILFFGDDLPEEIDEIEAGDYFYADAVTTNGSAGLLLCTAKLDPFTLTRSDNASSLNGKVAKACSVAEGDMGDVFDELDANGDLNDASADLESEELTDEESGELEEFLILLDDNTLTNLCVGAFPESTDALDECLEPEERVLQDLDRRGLEHHDGRNLFGRRFRRRARRFVRKIKRALDLKISLAKTITFVDLDEGAKMVCEAESGNRATEIGIGFDLSARARFRIEVKTISGFQSASVNLFGGFGVKGYALLTATLEKRLQPKPKKILQRDNRRVFAVGPVPIVINIRPNLSAFTEAALVVESDVLVAAQFGYDYDFGFSVVKGQGFKKTSKFTQRPIFEEDPVFDLRINAAAEIGFTFALDVVLFGLLQGTLAMDLGLGAEIEVGTNVEALVVTQPFFYTLDKFELDAFVRIRAFVGLNSALTDVVRKIEDLKGSDNLECVISRGRFEVPELPDRDPPETPSVLGQALEQASDGGIFSNSTSISLEDLLGGLQDDFSPGRGALEGQSLDFGLNFLILNEDLFLAGIPVINTVSGGVQTCQGDDAIILTINTELEKDLFKTGLNDGTWFSNFDGTVLAEDTNWNLDADRSNTNTISMRLPRSAIASQELFEIVEESSVILRATPEILPFPPKSMFAKASLIDIFEDFEAFECCQDDDCVVKLGEADAEEERFCTGDNLCDTRNATTITRNLRMN